MALKGGKELAAEFLATISSSEFEDVPLELLEVDPQNIGGEAKIDEEFRNSIERGIIQPLVIRPISSIKDEKARERYRKMQKLTGIGESTIRNYLLLSGSHDFKVRLKKPESAPFNEKKLLAREQY